MNKIQEAIENKSIDSPQRPYLGYSAIGHPCSRLLWYSFHWVHSVKLKPRIKRIFEHGDWEEEQIVRDLEKAGILITYRQLEIQGAAQHIRGHIDGIATRVPGAEKTIHLFEAKSANDRRYKEYLKEPLDIHGHANERLKKWSPQYYAQVNSYMGKIKINRTLFVVTNKNTEDRTYDRLHFDQINYEMMENKSVSILMSEFPPEKLSDKPSWHECKYCNAKNVCHHNEYPQENCRTCQYVALEDNGKWSCEFHNMKLTEKMQRQGCDKFELLEYLKND